MRARYSIEPGLLRQIRSLGKKKRSRCGCAESTKGGGWRRQTLELLKPHQQIPNWFDYGARHGAMQAEFVRCRIGVFMGQ
jgi:hypothetical protein